MEDKDKVYIVYSPLRNQLKKAKLIDSLVAIHSHINHQLFRRPLPSFIVNFPLGYDTANNFQDFLKFHLMPWEIEIITKELLINADPFGGEKTLKDWNYLCSVVNKLKNLGNEISKIYIDRDKVLLELYRYAHWQFKWEENPNLNTLAKYWKIYSYPELSKVISDSMGITLQEIYLIGAALIGVFLDNFILFFPPNIQIKGLERRHLENFLNHFCLDYASLRKKMTKEQAMDDKFEHSYSSLEAYPIIRMILNGRDSLICPITSLLFDRITTGLYYEIVKHPDFDNAFGMAFQNFIGNVLSKGRTQAQIIPEEKYGECEKRTVDWILDDDTATLLIECKTKRLTLGAKTEILDDSELKRQINKMAEIIIQVYKQILDFKAGLYPQLKYDGVKNVYPVIVTLEEWYFFGDKILSALDEAVTKLLRDENLPERLLKDHPYSVCSIKELENIAQISSEVKIDDIFKGKVFDREFGKWPFQNYLLDKFPNQMEKISNLFSDEFEKFIIEAAS